ncbi:MAG: acetyl esterase/lipase [Gammaproteobacteria bacterium]|jgi:acetyl esterase/lipase
MTFKLDLEFAAVFAPFADALASAPLPAVGDIETRRETFEAFQRKMHDQLPMPSDVVIKDFEVATEDGARLLLRWYAKEGSLPGSAVYYVHGGGMILSNVSIYDRPVSRYVSTSGVPFLSVEYRYAPEHPHPVPVEDCYAGLSWLVEHADELGVDPARIAVMGDSGGGGVAAGLAIVSRDRPGPKLAKQILIYPMLDDRNLKPDPNIVPFMVWSYEDNLTGWRALLGEAIGSPDASEYAAPARLADPSGLPPAYIEVGELDIFREEDVEYARRLAGAGVSTELHVRPGVPHAWEVFAPGIDVSVRSYADRIRTIQDL